jgi:ABC-2 type transport system permease protein
MKTIWAIAVKDFKGIVFSPTFLVLASLCSAIWSYVYLRFIQAFAQQSAMPMMGGAQRNMNLHYDVFVNHASFVNLIFLFVVPALTMRLISEEKKQGTFDLLLTTPITATDIMLGKFFGGFFAVSVLVAISMFYPLATGLLGKFPWAPLLLTYVGVLLVSASYVAVGLFASSLTDSVVLSVVLGVLFNLILWFVSQSPGMGEESSPVFMAVMEHLSLGLHFQAFLKGTIQISSIAYFLSVISLFLFLTQRVVESARWR